MFFQRPALLALRVREVELTFDFTRLLATVQATDKLIVFNHSFVGTDLTGALGSTSAGTTRGIHVRLRLQCRSLTRGHA
eukprot:1748717-Amphidinium_carterae.1